MNRVTILILGIMLIAFSTYGIYKELVSPKLEMQEELSAQDYVEQIKSEKDRILNFKFSNPTELTEFREELIQKYSKPESAVEYLIAMSMLQDPNWYPDAFISSTYNQDIFGHSEINKVKLVERIMDQITRNGTLTKFEHQNIKWTTDNKTARVLTDFYYEDLENPIRLNFLVTKKDSEILHDTENAQGKTDFYYINTSVWEIIDAIERGVQNNE